MIAGKVWGNTELVEANGALEFHRIEMNQGGTCSKHLHEFKWNGFYVESGRMLIRVWQKDYDLVDETILEAGQCILKSSQAFIISLNVLKMVSRLSCTGQNLTIMILNVKL
jgi:hypothetical protein